MARTKGAKNKEDVKLPSTMTLSTKDRIEFLAAILVDRIIDAQMNNLPLRLELKLKSHVDN